MQLDETSYNQFVILAIQKYSSTFNFDTNEQKTSRYLKKRLESLDETDDENMPQRYLEGTGLGWPECE